MEQGLLPSRGPCRRLLALWDVQLASTGYINLDILPHILTLTRWVCTPEKEEKPVSTKQSTGCVIGIESTAQTRSAVTAFTPVEL